VRVDSRRNAGARQQRAQSQLSRARSARSAAARVPAQAQPAGPQGAFDAETAARTRRKLFDTIAPVYDELNDRLSFGRHWQWKRDAVAACGATPGHRALDVCCGSGDLAFLLARAVGAHGRIVGLDFAPDMLDYAEQRRASEVTTSVAASPGDRACAILAQRDAAAQVSSGVGPIEWVQGDATAMPFPDASFDAVTMGFGLRNVNDIPAALREIHRVLRPGGRAAILDFNNSPSDLFDGIQVMRSLLPSNSVAGGHHAVSQCSSWPWSGVM
jgi:demethylphylloquinol methyltransferase